MAALALISPVVWQVPRATCRPLHDEGVTLGFMYASFILSSEWAVYIVSKIPVPITYFRKLKYRHVEGHKLASLCLALTIREGYPHIFSLCFPYLANTKSQQPHATYKDAPNHKLISSTITRVVTPLLLFLVGKTGDLCIYFKTEIFNLVGISFEIQETLPLLSPEGGEVCVNLLVMGEFIINPIFRHELQEVSPQGQRCMWYCDP